MTRNWAPLDGPQRAMTRLRAKRDGGFRSVADLELPLMGLLALLVGIGVAMWLNGLGSPGSGEVRAVTERPVLANPRAALAAGAAERRAEAARAEARARRARAARVLARRRAAAAAFARRTGTDEQRGAATFPQSAEGFTRTTETYTQQAVPQATAPKPSPAPTPKPKPVPAGGGGFDDSG